MIKAHSFTSAKNAAGFTLLELLLTVGLLGLLLAGMYGIMNGWTERAIDRQAATDMLRIRTAAHDYVLAKFDQFKADAANTFIEIPVNDLKPDNYLPSGYVAINAFRQPMRIFRRNLKTPQIDKDGNVALDVNGNAIILTTIEVVVVSDNPSGDTLRVGNKRLVDAATAGGPSMGVVAEIVMPNETFTNTVRSISRQWGVQLSSLAAVGYTGVPDTLGGYLATYDLVNSESSDANDHWLYRVPIDGRPELNRMATDLNMNANQLQNVGTVVADKFNVSGNAAFRGQAQTAATDTAQGMTVEQALRVDTSGDVRINMKSASCSFSAPVPGGNRIVTGSGCGITGGELQVVGERKIDPATGVQVLAAGDGTLTANNLTADGNVVTDFTNVNNTTDVAGISTFDTVAGRDMFTNTTVVAPRTNVTGTQVTTDNFQTRDMNVTSGAVVQNQLVMARAAPGLNHQFITNQLEVGNAVELSGKLGAANATATNTLYLDNAQAPGGYTDSYFAGSSRYVECVPYGGRTYCEPRGQTYYLGNTVYDVCTATGTGYSCQYFRQVMGVWQPYGSCTFTRSVGASGQAYEAYSCT